MPRMKPISDIQRNMSAVVQECQATKAPLYLTKNGKATLVVMDAEAFDREMAIHQEVYDREMRVRNAILRGCEDAADGRVRTLSQARSDAKRMREAAHG